MHFNSQYIVLNFFFNTNQITHSFHMLNCIMSEQFDIQMNIFGKQKSIAASIYTLFEQFKKKIKKKSN